MNVFYLQAILTASIGGLLYGYDMGVISGALPLLSSYFQLTPSQEEWVVSLLYFGGGVGAASGGFICDWFGRKTAIMFTDVMFSIGAFLLYSADTVESVMVGRFVVGWAVAVSGIADVVYLHEISSVWDEQNTCNGDRRRYDDINGDVPNSEVTTNTSNNESNDAGTGGTNNRGSVVSVNEACISLGFLLAYGVAYSLGGESEQSMNLEGGANEQGATSDAWRIMFGFGGCIAAAQFLGMLCMPESPEWLRGNGRIEEATAASNRIRGTVDGYLRSTSSADSIIEMSATNSPQQPSDQFVIEEQSHTAIGISRATECLIYLWMKLRSAPSLAKNQYQRFVNEIISPYKRQCTIAFFLAASQQFCGHPSVLSFSSEIFTMLNGSNSNNGDNTEDMSPIELTVGIGVLKFLTTCIVILCIERGGRRCWLLSGMSCILISLTFLCISFIGKDSNTIENNSDNDGVQQPYSSSFMNDLGIVGIYGVAIGYGASYAPLTWLITSELFPSSIRGRALGFATVITYCAAGLVSRTFLSLQDGIGLAATFSLYWIATAVSIGFVCFGIPDTGGDRTPEEIDREMNDMWMWGGNGRHHTSSRCPLFIRLRSRGDDRNSTSSWTSIRGYGSWGSSVNDDSSDSPDSISNKDAGSSSPTVIKRRSTSSTNSMKEII